MTRLPEPNEVECWVNSPNREAPVRVKGREYQCWSVSGEVEALSSIANYQPGRLVCFAYEVWLWRLGIYRHRMIILRLP